MEVNDGRPTNIDLFSGIGGFSLAAESVGWRTVVFCEKDRYCQRILGRHWSDVPVIGDIRDFDPGEYRGASLLTGGFPCQPFSQANGKRRKGTDDDRFLWPEMRRVIKGVRPDFILAENVVGIINMALDEVLSDLESIGYSTGPVVIPAASLNAHHRRDRVFIIAADTERSERRNEPHGGASGRVGWEPQPFSWDIPSDEALCDLRGMDDGAAYTSHRVDTIRNAVVPAIPFQILKLI